MTTFRNGLMLGGLAALLLAQGCGNQGIVTTPSAYAGLPLARSSGASAQQVPNRLVVKFRAGTSDSQMRAFQQRFSLGSVHPMSAMGVGVLSLPPGRTNAGSLGAIQSHPAVEYAEPDYVFSTSPVRRTSASAVRRPARRVADVLPFNDPSLPQQWGPLKIGLPSVWGVASGSPGVVVAVIDTGVDLNHPDLHANLVAGVNILSLGSAPNDDHGHGTHCAGIIAAAADNGIGVVGVAPHCKIMPVKVLNAKGQGDTGDIITGIQWAVDHGAKVLNLSLGGIGGSHALMDAIAYAESKDVVICAAMGNEGKNSQEYPAGYPGVIAVGSTDASDSLSDFSNFGAWISVCAPGSDILSTLPTYDVTVNREEGKNTGYDTMSGTSMATPFVSGLAGLLRSQFPTLNAAAIKARIERSADDLGDAGFDEKFGHGRINASRALYGR